jgi:CheY-like chemotaxis protein
VRAGGDTALQLLFPKHDDAMYGSVLTRLPYAVTVRIHPHMAPPRSRAEPECITQPQGDFMSDLSLGRRSILCIEDDAESRTILQEILADHRLVFACSAFEALRRVNAEFFHGYVLDYWLPDWSGPSLCREIRKIDPHAPIVFCTAAVRDADRNRALRAGASAYLCKPIEPEVLRSKLRTFLTLAEMESLRAKIEEEHAVQSELQRRLSHVQSRVDTAKELVASSIERTAKAKAYKAFIEARGTRAHFENWWPHVYQSARANHDIT